MLLPSFEVERTEREWLITLKTQADIYIINLENIQWLIEKSGVPFGFDMLVIDELSSFKNHQTKRFKALMKIRPKRISLPMVKFRTPAVKAENLPPTPNISMSPITANTFTIINLRIL